MISRKKLPVKFTNPMITQLNEYHEALKKIIFQANLLHTAGVCGKGRIKKAIDQIAYELKVYDAHIIALLRIESRDIILPSGEAVVEKIVEIPIPPDENKIKELVARYIKDFMPKEPTKTKEKEPPQQPQIIYVPAEPDQLTKAHQLFFGFGTQKNYIEAFKLYKECDQKGNLVATNCLGRMYFEGIGVKKDISKAIEFYIKSAAKQDSEGLYRIGTLLEVINFFIIF